MDEEWIAASLVWSFDAGAQWRVSDLNKFECGAHMYKTSTSSSIEKSFLIVAWLITSEKKGEPHTEECTEIYWLPSSVRFVLIDYCPTQWIITNLHSIRSPCGCIDKYSIRLLAMDFLCRMQQL